MSKAVMKAVMVTELPTGHGHNSPGPFYFTGFKTSRSSGIQDYKPRNAVHVCIQ